MKNKINLLSIHTCNFTNINLFTEFYTKSYEVKLFNRDNILIKKYK